MKFPLNKTKLKVGVGVVVRYEDGPPVLTPKNSVHIKKRKMKQCDRNPVTEHVHRVYDHVQSIVVERQPLRYAYVERNRTSRRYEVVE